jgi:hypothetical protein
MLSNVVLLTIFEFSKIVDRTLRNVDVRIKNIDETISNMNDVLIKSKVRFFFSKHV